MKNKPSLIPTQMDWARLAAFIDGEGSIFITKVQRKVLANFTTIMGIDIANTDIRLITWLLDRFGGCITSCPRNNSKPNWSQVFHWRASSNDAKAILENCLEHFILKRGQAELAIAHQSLCASSWSRQKINPERLEARLVMRDKLSLMKGNHTRRKDLPRTPTIN